MWKIMKIIVEPTSALVLAAIKKNASLFEGRKVGAIITGGNVDIVYK
jgi:threonine dehydratase